MTPVIHNKTGKLYLVKTIWAEDCTNGSEGNMFTIYKRPFKKKIYVRRTWEFSMKFTCLNEVVQKWVIKCLKE